ncbi:MAG: formate/nitrite transporter family protein [Oscillospiraceae bacterium]|nr:formate/nitrite transporter family protein [Oscillospiraceae bacterium]
MKRFVDVFLRAVMTGFAIGIGAVVSLCCDNKYLGAFLFGTGLFVILSFGFNLYTGKVGYAVEEKPRYILDVAVIWLGNLAGTAAMGAMILCTRLADTVVPKAVEMCEAKLSDTPISIFILAIFCGMLMFIAADGYKKIDSSVGKTLAIFLPVMVFILSGYEHCIANMFYYALAGAWTVKSTGYLIIMTLGNAVGGMFIPLVKKCFISNA